MLREHFFKIPPTSYKLCPCHPPSPHKEEGRTFWQDICLLRLASSVAELGTGCGILMPESSSNRTAPVCRTAVNRRHPCSPSLTSVYCLVLKDSPSPLGHLREWLSCYGHLLAISEWDKQFSTEHQTVCWPRLGRSPMFAGHEDNVGLSLRLKGSSSSWAKY